MSFTALLFGKKNIAVALFVLAAIAFSIYPAHANTTRPPLVNPITGQAPVRTYVVTKTSDTGDNTKPGNGTLRRAIVDANASPGFDAIVFDIPGSGVQTIKIVNYLTELKDNDGVMIDGTQSDDQIELDGSGTHGVHGLYVTSNNNVIKGLTVNGVNDGAGIWIGNASNNVLIGNRVGTNPAGTGSKPNLAGILLSNADRNTIGGTDGVSPGGACTGDCNLVSGNKLHGIVLDKSNYNRIVGNFVGLNARGNGSLVNAQDGILVGDGHHNTIGGSTPQERNVVSGNQIVGIELGLANAHHNVVQGNYIGTNSAGNAAVTGNGAGVLIITAARDNEIDGNLISGNSKFGVLVFNQAKGNEIKNNRIGMAADSDANIGNGKQGIEVQTSGNLIHNNRVAYSHNDGIRIKAGSNNLVSQNSTFENATFGINLGADAFTPNDNGDGDGGPNGNQNFPIISSAEFGGTTLTIKGTLNSRPNGTYTIELFQNPACDNTFGNAVGESKTYLTSVQVTTDGSGNTNFTAQVPNGPSDGVITGTATDSANNTSELSYCRSITANSKPGKPQLVAPDNGGSTSNPPTLIWNAATNADHYQVLVRRDNPKGTIVHKNKAVQETLYVLPVLEPGATYVWRIKACNASNQCSKSGWFSFTIPASLQQLSPINGQNANNPPTLVWAAPAIPDHYQVIIRRDNNKGPKVHHNKSVTADRYVPPPLPAGTVFVWRVKACDANNKCTNSSWAPFQIS